jgi:two-component system response regulator YesN
MPKLLIVDDDEYIRTGLKHLIPWEELGVEVIGEAEGGNAAYLLFLENAPQIVLTDIRMPDGDGLELIRKIRAKGWDTHIIVLSGYNDYSYVRQAMKYQVEDYLLKPVDSGELEEIVKGCCEQLESRWMNKQIQKESFQLLRNNIFIRWVENRIDNEQLREKLDFLGVDIGFNRLFQVAVITWKDAHEENISEKEQKFRPFAIWNAMEEILDIEKRGVVFLNYEQQVICIMSGGKQDPETFARENLTWIQEKSEAFASVLKTPWYCSLGMPVKQPGMLHASYRDARKLQDIIETAGSVQCLDRSSVTMHLELPIPSMSDRDQIITDLIAGRREHWNEALQSGFQWAISQSDPLAAAKYDASEWIAAMKDGIRQLRIEQENTLLGDRVLTRIFSETTVASIKKLIIALMQTLEQYIQEHLAHKKNPLILKMDSYLREHFHEELSLQILADRFNVSSIYLGRLFKAEAGEYFSNYINKLRLEEAKRLLKESHLKTVEIAEKIGFLDPNYFYRKFKQAIGLSPTEYRKLHTI